MKYKARYFVDADLSKANLRGTILYEDNIIQIRLKNGISFKIPNIDFGTLTFECNSRNDAKLAGGRH